MELEKTVLITAGASGIGKAIAEAFLMAGSQVHICDVLERNIETFIAANPGASATLCDVSDAGQVDRMFDDFNCRHATLDVLVNNVGVAGPTAAVEDISVDDWNHCLAVNLNGPFYVTRRATPLLKQAGGGSIINIASNAGQFGCPLRSPYAASKWAIIGLTKTWAMELGRDDIRVNAICPGNVKGERIDAVIERDASERGVDSEVIRDIYRRQNSMRTFVDGSDIANMAVFLASDLGRHLSGQTIGIDGHTEGLSAWLD